MPSNPSQQPSVGRATPIILAVAMFMEMMDGTVIATSLPAIAADIGTEPIALKLAMTAYLVALAIFIPVSGWMADRFGAKNVFRWAIFVFMLGSLACAFAYSLPSFVVSRFFQGMGGAMMTPLARLVLVRVTPKQDLVSAMAWLTVPALMGPIMGPPIGGFLTTFLSWHWIFLINIPIGTIGIVAATLFLPHIPSGPDRPIDWWGFILCGTAFSGILFGLSVISLPALPPVVGIATCLLGLVAGIAYLGHARKVAFPLLKPDLLRNKLFRTAIIGGMLFRIGMGAFPFLFPLMLQVGFGLTPFETGMITLYAAVGAIGAKFFAKRVYARFGFKPLLLTMATLSACSLVINGLFTPLTPAWVMIGVLFVTGLIRSTFFTGINAMSFGDISEEDAGQATAFFAVTTQLSFALGVALAGGILEIMTLQRGGEVLVGDFQQAFWLVGAFSALAVLPFLALSRDAGSSITGHRRAKGVPDDPIVVEK